AGVGRELFRQLVVQQVVQGAEQHLDRDERERQHGTVSLTSCTRQDWRKVTPNHGWRASRVKVKLRASCASWITRRRPGVKADGIGRSTGPTRIRKARLSKTSAWSWRNTRSRMTRGPARSSSSPLRPKRLAELTVSTRSPKA